MTILFLGGILHPLNLNVATITGIDLEISLQAGHLYRFNDPEGYVGFVETQNQGINTVSIAKDLSGGFVSESKTIRGTVGRYILKLTGDKGNVATSIEIKSFEPQDYASGSDVKEHLLSALADDAPQLQALA